MLREEDVELMARDFFASVRRDDVNVVTAGTRTPEPRFPRKASYHFEP